jgi:hypothetical protein
MTTITPETTVAALLDSWPELESELLATAPVMGSLRNPVLRKAVAESATLARVAELAAIPAPDLVKRLRDAAGLRDSGTDARVLPAAPDWALESRVRFDIDADAMLATGVHPIGTVRNSAMELQAGDVLRLRSGFRPQPLIEAMQRAGLEVWCGEAAPGRFVTLMRRTTGGDLGPLPSSCGPH